MGKKQVTILDSATDGVAEAAFFIEGKGLPETAKRFVDDVFAFFEKLSDKAVKHHPCTYPLWKNLNYRCVAYKKYTVAYLFLKTEIVICEFVPSKLIHW
jgi:plasmid stabilization system protein ParE